MVAAAGLLVVAMTAEGEPRRIAEAAEAVIAASAAAVMPQLERHYVLAASS